MKESYIKTAIVTGASKGIGYSIAKYLASKGYHLLLIARNRENLTKIVDRLIEEHVTTLPPIICALDVNDFDKVKFSVEKFVTEVGHIDLLCNNAGYVKRGTSELSHTEFLKMINTNLIGAFNFINIVTPFMKANGSGRIINISSRSGKIARKELGGYAASKFGLMGFNEALYRELAKFGIYVSAICPNLVNTDMTADVDMDRHNMIQTNDIVKTIDYILSLSPAVAIKEILLECQVKLLED